MSCSRLFSHKWDYAEGGARACKRCGTEERFNTLKSEWQGF